MAPVHDRNHLSVAYALIFRQKRLYETNVSERKKAHHIKL